MKEHIFKIAMRKHKEIICNQSLVCTVGVGHNPNPLQTKDSHNKVMRYSCVKKACLAV